MRNLVIYLFLFVSISMLAQNANDLFLSANSLYKEGKYEEAIKLYEQIENENLASSEVYYNLANCYYKLNKIAPTIYNYEKALQLNPLNEDAKNNLVIAKRLTLDRVEALPKSVFQKLNENYLQKFTYNTWAVITVVFSFMASILFLLFYFSYTPSKKRTYFTTSIISFLFLTSSLAITYIQYNQAQNNIEAIIYSEEVSVKNEPTNNSNEIFTLHEGTKVNILDSVDNWKKLKLTDGKIGWVKTKTLKEL
ncbi:SH3 domain-containing protein [Tenacibaculum sp. Mcav3-52]|uniref:Tetratricopeptide repeat protein n=1 Tax=Tenacibaculum mesophilum TaxID=104268 RepID=A0ABM7CG99_9FLAO|nr:MULTISPECIES: CDC27 family protein [Tenacibaculum]AZJ32813.1 tetratricopeptide repeat protein [Tenacibaculum mesophilum]KAF9658996.1 SH3 domain-containing protein [Tenacibaculum mesophilum]MCG7500986.1 SH3 domain-containing protein [Tenacibaculum sp. Mcav3-52]QFS28059.1 SH3 domain-containing protein [Tenacibaculum mesophilum]SHF73659.1 Anaphase-promoting complex, cyclosome, subunit 3 [Tenacibaculum mesophilum]